MLNEIFDITILQFSINYVGCKGKADLAKGLKHEPFSINYVGCKENSSKRHFEVGNAFSINYVGCKVVSAKWTGISNLGFLLTMWDVKVFTMMKSLCIFSVFY